MLRYDPNARKPKASQTLVNNVRRRVGFPYRVVAENPYAEFAGGAASPNLLAVRNGLLDLDSLLTGKTGAKDVLRPHTPEWFSCNCLPVDYQPGADCSFWVDTLNVLLLEDQQRINLLQEWAGYCLWRGFNAQKFLILCGDGGTGKSTVLAALMALLGEDNCISITFSANGDDRFVYGPTLGKMLAFSADTSKIDRLAEGPFKSFTTGESMTFEDKFCPKFTAKPTAKLMFATNELPHFSDKSDGIWRRPLYVPMEHKVSEEDKVPGMDAVSFWEPHLPGLLCWSLDGLRRLRERHWRFTQPESSAAAAREHRMDADSARAFLMEHFSQDPAADQPIPKADLYSVYSEWCRACGVKYPFAIRTFGKTLRRVFSGVDEAQTRMEGRDGVNKVRDVWLHLRLTKGVDGVSSYGSKDWLVPQP